MNRNYPAYNGLSEEAKQEAASRETSKAVLAAIAVVAKMSGRNVNDVRENPSRVEFEHVEMCLNDWCHQGDIDADTYHWGCESIEVVGY